MTDRPNDDRIEFLRTLRAIRRFTDEPVADEALTDVLTVARWTGSAMNRQPWAFVVVRDPETLKKLAEAYPSAGHLAGAPVAIVLVMAGERPMEHYDEGRLTERILLAAKARGLGAAVGWLGNDGAAPVAKELLGIPAARFVRSAISLGHPAPDPDQTPRPQPRKPLAELVHWERY